MAGDRVLSFSVLVHGWRFVPHSYALVNQWQCLELLRRPDVSLFMHDSPFVARKWQAVRGLMPAADEEAIARLPKPTRPPDAVLRISVPVNLDQARYGRAFVLGTADFGLLPPRMIKGGKSVGEALAGSDTMLVTPSNWSRHGLLRSGAQPERIALVPHGVDGGVFRPASPKERERLRAARGWSDRFVFLNVSAMSLSKGTDLLLKAFARVAQRHEHVVLMLKGSDAVYQSEGWLKRWLAEKLTAEERRAISDRIVYTGGSVGVRAVANLFRIADAYVTPYRTESFNLPALEAAACGLPVICTAGGPTDDYTTRAFARHISAKLIPKKGYENEIQFQPDLDELTDAMLAMVDDDGYREAARAAGPAHVAERYSWRSAVDTLLAAMRGGAPRAQGSSPASG